MLKRDISTTNILIASAGGMIGSGWLFSPFISAQMAGSNALVSWVIAAVFMLFIALPLCELGAMFPVSGGMSNYPTFTHGPEVGFLFAWTSWLSYVVMTPIEIQAILQYSSYFFPGLMAGGSSALTLSGYGYVVAVCIMLFVVILNSYGIKMLAECNKYASIIKFLLPGIAIMALLGHSPTWSNVSIHLADKESWVQIFSALSAGGVAFAFTGFQNGLMLGGEVKNPQRNIPIAILGAVLIGFVLYFMLQFSFIAAMPSQFLAHGWQGLSYPGDSAPLVGLTLLLGLSVVGTLLLIDAAFSPFGTTLVYTAATSRILYGMALNNHLPKLFLKVNRHNIPYITLYANFAVGVFSFLPFPGWQKLVAFLSSASILSYGIGPVCLLAMRKLQPDTTRPFRLPFSRILSHIAFYICNLMLYWCGFSILWKLYVALLLGLGLSLVYHRKRLGDCGASLYWFLSCMTLLLLISGLGTFGGAGILAFPWDMLCLFPFSVFMLYWSQTVLDIHNHDAIDYERMDGAGREVLS
ncbi:APC family permease [Legionella spiritensis]|uniref:Putative amino acid transporter n=1 Tax=Legionella spiritensis TaxID=452 RepID=A0A0W0ZB05_LEGSP|nr:APC family permease [Legionella spiritensis]KTD66338.1 putative amino acid transporter [Legionella spiritensis]SNV48698.1 amino acid transporters [Legionella spiritensis]VEG91549.1 amino acid transporters [Legionella spiritensis]